VETRRRAGKFVLGLLADAMKGRGLRSS
jgi:hypothetical protein